MSKVDDQYSNPYFTIDDLDLTDEQKKDVLMWYARKLWVIIEESSGEPDYYCKSYDPLLIDDVTNIAYSYVFDLNNGGRTHPFKSLEQLEEWLTKETIERCNRNDQ